MANSLVTANGVCYDAQRTPFTVHLEDFTFHFSTEKHRQAFKAKALLRREWLNDSLSRRFHFEIDTGLLAIFQLYEQIEKRWFWVENVESKEVYRCPQEVRFDGLLVSGSVFSEREGHTIGD